MAIVTARGMTALPTETGEILRRGYTVTDVFQRQDAGWFIINEHESASDLKEDGS